MHTPSFLLETLKKRREFQEAGRGPRYSTPAFTMLRRLLSPDEHTSSALQPPRLRFGFTVTKKIGNSPERNRMRRRLKEAVRAASSQFPVQSLDLVILARRNVMDYPFASLTGDILRAVQVIARKDTPPPRKPRP